MQCPTSYITASSPQTNLCSIALASPGGKGYTMIRGVLENSSGIDIAKDFLAVRPISGPAIKSPAWLRDTLIEAAPTNRSRHSLTAPAA